MTRHRVDWDAIERDFRIGQLTNTELSLAHGIDPATLSRKIKSDKAKDPSRWERDLTEVVRQATNARLIAEAVKESQSQEQVKASQKQGQEQVKSVVNAAAETRTQVILSHRRRAGRAVDVAMRMLDELDTTTMKPDELEALFAKASGADEEENPTIKRALMQQFRDFMRLHNRVASAQKLMSALKDAQALEAQAFGGLYDDAPPEDPGRGKTLSDAERASRLATIMERARRAAVAPAPTESHAVH